MAPILANPEVQQRLMPYLPSGESLPQSTEELHNTLSSPQFQQVKCSLPHPLRSPSLELSVVWKWGKLVISSVVLAKFGFKFSVENVFLLFLYLPLITTNSFRERDFYRPFFRFRVKQSFNSSSYLLLPVCAVSGVTSDKHTKHSWLLFPSWDWVWHSTFVCPRAQK